MSAPSVPVARSRVRIRPSNPLRRRTPLDLPPLGKLIAYVILILWTFVVLFPIYWLAITSFKLPVQVDRGPFFIPFVDFQPTLDAWKYILFDLGNDTIRPYMNTVIVGLSSSIIALVLGSLAAYALVRFTYRPRVAFWAATWSGMVWALALVSTRAIRNSFQAKIRTIRNVATSPGTEIGRTIERTIR